MPDGHAEPEMPAIIDQDVPYGSPLAMFESGAILIYLAERCGLFLPAETRGLRPPRKCKKPPTANDSVKRKVIGSGDELSIGTTYELIGAVGLAAVALER